MSKAKNTLAMIEQLKEIISLVLPLCEDDPLQETPSEIYRLIRDTLRKNLMRLQAISVLCGYDKMGDGALEITRNMVEDVLSVNYILSSSNPESLAHKFYEYRWVQAKQDYKYYSKLNQTPTSAGKDKVDKELERVLNIYPEFTKKDGSLATSWSKDGVDGMAKKLIKRKVFPKSDMSNMLRLYQRGSRKTHFNPEDIINYGTQADWNMASLGATRISILTSSACIRSLVLRYFDILSHYADKKLGFDFVKSIESIHTQIQELDQ